MGATVLDQLISSVAGAGSSILRIFEMGDSSKVNYYTFSAFSKRTSPTNTDATFTSLNYIGGSGTTTFAKPCISLSVSGGSGTAGTSGISTANARASNLYTSVSNQTEFSIGYTVGQVDVYVNGVKLASSDFTATNGTSVILDTAPPTGSLVGDLLAILGAALAAGYVLIGSKAQQKLSTSTYTTACYLTCATTGLVLAIASGSQLFNFEARQWWLVVALIIGAQLLGHTMFNLTLPRVSPVVVSLVVFFEVPVSAIIAYIWLDQIPAAGIIPGIIGLLIGCGIFVSRVKVRPEND
jgi:hypothetical protein